MLHSLTFTLSSASLLGGNTNNQDVSPASNGQGKHKRHLIHVVGDLERESHLLHLIEVWDERIDPSLIQ